MMERHEFALYCPAIVRTKDIITITDSVVVNRINTILRLRVGEELVLFDDQCAIQCTIQAASKKEIQCLVLNTKKHTPITPPITFILPLLKKDDFETALYALVELGVTAIQLVTTAKTQRPWGGEKEFDRCQRIMIAAAEQSKNFALPTLHAPVALSTYLASLPSGNTRIFFDPQGESARDVMQHIANQSTPLVLMVGPEGDLTAAEKELLQSQKFTFCALTPTVLRSTSAITIGTGLVRSCAK